MTLRPTTQQHHRPISLSSQLHLLELDQPPRLETPPQLFDGKRFAFPRRRVALGRAAGIPPTCLVHRLLQLDPVELPIAEKHDLRSLRDQASPVNRRNNIR